VIKRKKNLTKDKRFADLPLVIRGVSLHPNKCQNNDTTRVKLLTQRQKPRLSGVNVLAWEGR